MKKNAGLLFSWLKTLSKNRKVIVIVLVVCAIFGIAAYMLNRDSITLRDTIAVNKSTIAKTVLSSGKVVSATDLTLSFQGSDIVKAINVTVGQKVKKGQILATLANAPQQAELTRARGVLLGAQARYRKTVEGASSADVIAADDALKNTERTQNRLVENARRRLFSDDLFADPQRTDMVAANAPIVSGTYTGTEETRFYLTLKQTNSRIEFSGPEKGDISVISLPQPMGNSGLMLSFPTLSYAYNDEWVIAIPNKTGKNYTTNLNAYNAALANRDELVAAAKSKLDVLKTAARRVDIDAAEADVLIAKAGVASADAGLEKTILRAPADGTITKVDIKLGDLVEANKAVITLQDVDNLYIESMINESDIVGVSVGQPVEITFEALGKHQKFGGEISSVDLGPTTNDSVVNYKVKALLRDPGIVRPGMTADLKISTASVVDAINIPSRYVGEQGSEHYVWVVTNEEKKITRKQIVSVGIKADGGIVEITQGLSIGDKVTIVE